MEKRVAALADWWDRIATPTFAHVDYTNHGGPHGIVRVWRDRWLDAVCPRGACNGLRVSEYGIGAGLLGEHMLAEGVAHYAGIDISKRSRASAKARLLARADSTRFSLHDANVSFASLRPDLFVSQQVIQHFPSQDYLDAFLRRVNGCGASTLMLQSRAPAVLNECLPTVSRVGYCQEHDHKRPHAAQSASSRGAVLHQEVYANLAVTSASLVSSSYLLERLPRYALDFVNRTLPQPHLPKRSPVDEYHVLRLRA